MFVFLLLSCGPAEFAVDADGDGWNAGEAGGDCDDGDAAVHPGASERCNGADDDCDGEVDEDRVTTWYVDADGDGVGGTTTTLACTAPPGTVATDGDCDDADALAYPGATEICDGHDQDCDGEVDEDVTPSWCADADGDGYTVGDAVAACTAPDGYSACTDTSDCNDRAADVYPGAIEEAEVGHPIDHDCDGEATFVGDATILPASSGADGPWSLGFTTGWTAGDSELWVGGRDVGDGTARVRLYSFVNADSVAALDRVLTIPGADAPARVLDGAGVFGATSLLVAAPDDAGPDELLRFDPGNSSPSLTLRSTADGCFGGSPLAYGGVVGRSLATGDVDGDGTDDLVVADPCGAHAVWAVPGPITAEGTMDLADLAPDVVTTGEGVGADVAIGDFTGDGRAEVAVGRVPLCPGDGTGDSGAYVFTEASTGWTEQTRAEAATGSGHTCVGAAVGFVRRADAYGEQLVVGDPEGGRILLYADASDGGISSIAEVVPDQGDEALFGRQFATGDVDGDGDGDIGAPSGGTMYVYFGPFDGTVLPSGRSSAPADADFGAGVTFGPDFNADHRLELAFSLGDSGVRVLTGVSPR